METLTIKLKQTERSRNILGRDRNGTKVILYHYIENGNKYTDLFTDGRVLLTPELAKTIALKLLKFAEHET